MSDMARMFFLAKAACSGAAPSDIVILPETEMMKVDVEEGSNGQYVLTTPLENTPSVGGTYKMVWGGVEYTSKAVELPSDLLGMQSVALGNTDYLGLDDVENPGADMPILVVFFPDGFVEDPGDPAAYCMAISIGITPDPPVLSIVQTEGGSADSGSDGAAASSLYIVKATEFTGPTVENGKQVYALTVDKTYAEVAAAIRAGKQYVVLVLTGLFCTDHYLQLPALSLVSDQAEFGIYLDGASFHGKLKSDNTATLTMSVS